MCEVIQNEYIGENENNVAVNTLLQEDVKFLKLFKQIPDAYIQINSEDIITCKIVNRGCVTVFPYFYFYFKNMYRIPNGRRVVLGVVCASLAVHATIEVDFYIYPTKSKYVPPDRVWMLPYWWVTSNITLLYDDLEEDEKGLMNHLVYQKTKLFFAGMDQCTMCTDVEMREVVTKVLKMYASFRLGCIIRYLFKMQYEIKNFMISECTCSRWSGRIQGNIHYVKPRCKCNKLCSQIIHEKFVDRGYVCDESDVLFNETV